MARRCTEVCTTSGRRPDSLSCWPPRTASARPLSVRSTSTQPVKRFLAFHWLSPCRRRMSVYAAAEVIAQVYGEAMSTSSAPASGGSSRCRNAARLRVDSPLEVRQAHSFFICLLYTSDAADEED